MEMIHMSKNMLDFANYVEYNTFSVSCAKLLSR